MKKSILILGVVALLGNKSFGMGISMSAQPMATMERTMMLEILTDDTSKESLTEKSIASMQKFRETVIQPLIKDKSKEEIAFMLLDMDEKKFLNLVRQTNAVLEISMSALGEIRTLSPNLLAQFKRESLILDTWANLLLHMSIERKR